MPTFSLKIEIARKLRTLFLISIDFNIRTQLFVPKFSVKFLAGIVVSFLIFFHSGWLSNGVPIAHVEEQSRNSNNI